MSRFLCFFLCLISISLSAQTSDNILWSKFTASYDVDQKTRLSFAPITRFNDDFSNYQDISFDYAYRRKLDRGFSLQLTGRTWFLRNGSKRQFIWPQISYANTFDKFKVSSFLRLHYALDINDVVDADFIRWKTDLIYPTHNKLDLFVGLEPWFRLDGNKEWQRMRYSLGFKYKFSKVWNLSLVWWRQESINLEPVNNVNIYVLNLSYLILNN